MNMIGLDRQLQDSPSFIETLLFYDLLAARFDVPNENRFSPFRTPEKMVDNEMDAMLISLIAPVF